MLAVGFKLGHYEILGRLTEAGGTPDRTEDLIALDQALDDLAKMDERKAQLIELHHFGGLTAEEAAEVLDISPRTAYREWTWRAPGSFARYAGKKSRRQSSETQIQNRR